MADLLEVQSEQPDLEGLLAQSRLRRKRELEEARKRTGEKYGGYGIFSGARQGALADIEKGSAEAGAAEESSLIANLFGNEQELVAKGLKTYTPKTLTTPAKYDWKTFKQPETAGGGVATGQTAYEIFKQEQDRELAESLATTAATSAASKEKMDLLTSILVKLLGAGGDILTKLV